MVTDSEPRYRLVDADGNVVGTFFAESDGTLKIQEGTSGNDNEVSIGTDGSLGVEQITDGFIYCAAFDGSSPDERLDNALTAASEGDTIYLESATYSDDRTFSREFKIIGKGHGITGFNEQTKINGSWTLNTGMLIYDVSFANAVDIDDRCTLISCGAYADSFSITGNQVVLKCIRAAGDTVTFESGTSGGIIDTTVNLSVTDNGSNTVGDVG